MRKPITKIISYTCLIIGLFSAPLALAGKIYLEPGVGGGMGTLSASGDVATTSPSLHLKMGSFTDYVYVLADAKITYLSPADTIDATWLNSLGLGLAFDWNIPVRLSIGVDLLNSTTITTLKTATTPASSTSLGGLGTRIGIGYYFSPNLLINLETQSINFSSVGGSAASYSTYTLSLSFPMEIDYPGESWRIRQGTKLR